MKPTEIVFTIRLDRRLETFKALIRCIKEAATDYPWSDDLAEAVVLLHGLASEIEPPLPPPAA